MEGGGGMKGRCLSCQARYARNEPKALKCKHQRVKWAVRTRKFEIQGQGGRRRKEEGEGCLDDTYSALHSGRLKVHKVEATSQELERETRVPPPAAACIVLQGLKGILSDFARGV